MLNLEILPRLTPDAYVDTMEEALEEADRRRLQPPSADAITRIAELPYGDFRVYTVSRSFAIELYTRLAEEGALPHVLSTPRRMFR